MHPFSQPRLRWNRIQLNWLVAFCPLPRLNAHGASSSVDAAPMWESAMDKLTSPAWLVHLVGFVCFIVSYRSATVLPCLFFSVHCTQLVLIPFPNSPLNAAFNDEHREANNFPPPHPTGVWPWADESYCAHKDEVWIKQRDELYHIKKPCT